GGIDSGFGGGARRQCDHWCAVWTAACEEGGRSRPHSCVEYGVAASLDDRQPRRPPERWLVVERQVVLASREFEGAHETFATSHLGRLVLGDRRSAVGFVVRLCLTADAVEGRDPNDAEPTTARGDGSRRFRTADRGRTGGVGQRRDLLAKQGGASGRVGSSECLRAGVFRVASGVVFQGAGMAGRR